MEEFEKIVESVRICAGSGCEGCMYNETDYEPEECTRKLICKAAEAFQKLTDWHQVDQDLIKELRKQVGRRADELKALSEELTALRCNDALARDRDESLRRDYEKLLAANDAIKWCVRTMCGGAGNAES